MQIEEILNLDAYPSLANHCDREHELVKRCRQELEQHLFCSIAELISPTAISAMVAEARALMPTAYHNNSLRNCYLHRGQDPSLPSDHPINLQDRSSVRMIAYDQLSDISPLKHFYQAKVVRELIAAIVGTQELFLNEDPYQPANYVCYEEGDESSWHFDEDNSFTMTLMIQAANAGGQFEISPNTRTESDQCYDQVQSVLKGRAADDVVSVSRSAGELCIFRGCHALHRVTKVIGDEPRIMGVFVYETEAGVVGDPEVNATIYGPRTQ